MSDPDASQRNTREAQGTALSVVETLSLPLGTAPAACGIAGQFSLSIHIDGQETCLSSDLSS